MVTMRSKVAHQYAGLPVKVGQLFEVEDRFVQTLTALGRAEVAEDKTIYPTRELEVSNQGGTNAYRSRTLTPRGKHGGGSQRN